MVVLCGESSRPRSRFSTNSVYCTTYLTKYSHTLVSLLVFSLPRCQKLLCRTVQTVSKTLQSHRAFKRKRYLLLTAWNMFIQSRCFSLIIRKDKVFTVAQKASSDLVVCESLERIFRIMMGSEDHSRSVMTVRRPQARSTAPLHPPPPPRLLRQQPDSSWLRLLTWRPNRPSSRPRWLELVINPSVVSEPGMKWDLLSPQTPFAAGSKWLLWHHMIWSGASYLYNSFLLCFWALHTETQRRPLH